MAPDDQNSSPLTRVTQVFGLFTGAAVLVYITGGVVLALRLGFDNLPFHAVVSQLPREFLISQGLSTVVFPAATGAALYVVYRLIRREPKQPKLSRLSSSVGASKWWKREFWRSVRKDIRDGRKVLFVAAGASAVLIASALGHEIIKQPEWRNGLLWFLLAFLLTLINMIAVLQVRALLVEKHFKRPEDRQGWNNGRVVAAMAALYAAAIVPGAIAFGATVPFLEAKVCRTTGADAVGSLIGETSDKVYLGLGKANKSDREIVVIPYDQVRQVLAGGDASDTASRRKDTDCPPQEESGTESGGTSSDKTGPTGPTGTRGRDGAPDTDDS